MMKKKSDNDRRLKARLSDHFDRELLEAVSGVEQRRGAELYVSGGTVRDLLLGRQPADLDITVQSGAITCCRELIHQLGGGAFVPLGTEEEEAARVVWRGRGVDFSSFRKGAMDIATDLEHRDFSINAMAVIFTEAVSEGGGRIIDPLGGRDDLSAGLLRHCAHAFTDDPLRMLRGYRFQAELGFILAEDCAAAIRLHSERIVDCAAERIQYELDHIMATGRAAAVFAEMAETGLLWRIFPELEQGLGMQQPGYHHEDVFHHNLLALHHIDRVMARPQHYFSDCRENIIDYLRDGSRCNHLRWSAIFHDLGKPATHSSGTMQQPKITFYNHDRTGREIFEKIAARLRWSRAATEVVAGLIEMHMHPFHLCNVRRVRQISRKACLRICKRAGDDLPGLFVLAMADSLAGQGELKPARMEEELAQLYGEIQNVNEQLIQPLLKGRRLLSGHDLIETFKLVPGPLFARIFRDLEIAIVEGRIGTRAEALAWVEDYMDSVRQRCADKNSDG